MKAALNNVTQEQLERAFQAWENGFRVDPSAYRTAEETAAREVSEVSAERADYFHELLTLEQAK